MSTPDTRRRLRVWWSMRARSHMHAARRDFEWAERNYVAGFLHVARANFENGVKNVESSVACDEQAELWSEKGRAA